VIVAQVALRQRLEWDVWRGTAAGGRRRTKRHTDWGGVGARSAECVATTRHGRQLSPGSTDDDSISLYARRQLSVGASLGRRRQEIRLSRWRWRTNERSMQRPTSDRSLTRRSIPTDSRTIHQWVSGRKLPRLYWRFTSSLSRYC